jgi:hypothetical protein
LRTLQPFVGTLTLALVAFLIVNATAAWDRRQHERLVQSLAADVRLGQAVLADRYFSERRFQRARIAVLPRPRVVAFGSSRVMPVSTEVAGVEMSGFYNTAVPGATVEDFVALWAALKRSGKVPDVAVLSIDFWTFNRLFGGADWRQLAEEVEFFLSRAEGHRQGFWLPFERAVYAWQEAKEMLSYTVLKASVARLERRLTNRRPQDHALLRTFAEAVVAEEDAAGRRALRADGSSMNVARKLGQGEIGEWVRAYAQRPEIRRFEWNADRARRLELLWRDLRAGGVEVIAYLPPYHPAAWSVLRNQPGFSAGLEDTARLLRHLSNGDAVHFFDFSDPASVPCSEREFFDGDHPNEACLGRLFAHFSLTR